MRFQDERLPQRFWSKVTQCPASECWLWTASTNKKGYGRINRIGRSGRAHRVAFEALVGAIPDGLALDHKCRRRNCVNPDHLEPVTNAENVRRGLAGINNSRKTHCPAGHPYSGENLVLKPRRHCARASRECRICRDASNAKSNAKKRYAKQNTNTEQTEAA